MDDNSWELGPGTELKRHRPLTGERIATLDERNASYMRQTLVISQAGLYQFSALFSADDAGSVIGYRVNHEAEKSLAIPRRWQWNRVGFDYIVLKTGDRLEVFFRSGDGFLNIEDAALYLQDQTPFDLRHPEPYRFEWDNISRIIPFLVCLLFGICAGLWGTIWGLRWWHKWGGRCFVALCLFGAMAAFGHAFELMDKSYLGSVFGMTTRFVGWSLHVSFLLLFCLWYVGSRWQDGWFPKTLLFATIVYCFLFVTDPWLHFIQLDTYIGWWAEHKLLARERITPIYYFGQTLVVIVQVLSVGILWVFASSTSKKNRQAIGMFSMGFVIFEITFFLFGMISTAFPSASWIEFGGIDASTPSLAIAITILVFATIRYNMIENNPTAWGRGQIDIADPMLVTDQHYQLVEMNARAKALFQLEPGRQNLSQIMPKPPLSGGDWVFRNRFYRVQSDPIYDGQAPIGYRYVFIDVTELEQREQQLRNANTQLESLQLILREQAIKDGLTGLYNRRYLDEWLKSAVRQEFGLVLFDIDYFREFNARFGYAGGDQVLRSIGEYLTTHLPAGAFGYRYGGEEFCIVLPGLTLEETSHFGEKLRQNIAEMRPTYQGKAMPVTVSVGVASSPDEIGSPLLAADKALQSAKRKGRNRSERPQPVLSRWGRGWG